MAGIGGVVPQGDVKRVLDFEGGVMQACEVRLAEYGKRAKKLGVELRPRLVQLKEGAGGRAALYPLREKGKLPGCYASRLTVYVFRDGRPLARQLGKGQVEYLVAIFWLVRGKKGALEFASEPLAEFDRLMGQILARVGEFTGQS